MSHGIAHMQNGLLKWASHYQGIYQQRIRLKILNMLEYKA
jgi:hypothetical protein